jgi:serine phosphatase RsbU (regulator of sigma subunit)
LFLYTDGVTEAAVPKTDEQSGEERLLAYLKANLANKPETINEQLVKTLQDFTGKREFEDDFTVLTLKIV